MSSKKQNKVNGKKIPKGAIVANPNKFKSGMAHVFYYEDINFKCSGCGVKSTWTAKQQQKYFEEQYGNEYNQPKWCFDCHKKRMK